MSKKIIDLIKVYSGCIIYMIVYASELNMKKDVAFIFFIVFTVLFLVFITTEIVIYALGKQTTGYFKERQNYFFMGMSVYFTFTYAITEAYSILDKELSYIVYAVGFVIYFLGYFIVAMCRNSNIYTKFHKYFDDNNYYECMFYINEKENQFPRTIAIKLYHLQTLLSLGLFDEYERYLAKLRQDKKYNREIVERTVENLNYIKAYLLMEETTLVPQDVKSISGGRLEKAVRMIYCKQHSDEKNMKLNASSLAGDSSNFYKCLAMIIRAEMYHEKNDIPDRKLYAKKALEYSPNEKITECLKKRIEVFEDEQEFPRG